MRELRIVYMGTPDFAGVSVTEVAGGRTQGRGCRDQSG